MKAKTNFLRCTCMYWLPKLHKRPYKARFIANSSSCTTTELSKYYCLPVKSHVIRYCETVYETSNKNWFWSIKKSGDVLRATSLSPYDFATLYTTLPHNLIKEKNLDLIEWTFKRTLKTMVHFIWPVMTERLSSLPLTKVGIYTLVIQNVCDTLTYLLDNIILDLGPSYIRSDLFYTATKKISWILLTMIIKLILLRLLIRLPGI